MGSPSNLTIEITPQVLLKAYACGIFPMAESADDPALYWIEPDMRGIIPLEGFHVPARLERTVRFHIDARLCLDPAPEVAFDTILELTTGHYAVRPTGT